MDIEKKNEVAVDQQQLPNAPRPKLIGGRPRRDTRDMWPRRRQLCEAVLLLAEKVESLGADVSDVTELLGIDVDKV